MSSEPQNNVGPIEVFETVGAGLRITISYEHNHGHVDLSGVVKSSDGEKLLVVVDKPAHLREVYVSECEEWDEALTVCRRDWRRLGQCVAIAIQQTPIYFDSA